MKNLFKILIVLPITLAFTGCGGSDNTEEGNVNTEETVSIVEDHYKVEELVDLDLSQYGLSIITKAPVNSRIIEDEVSNEIVVYGGKFFKVAFSTIEDPLESEIQLMKSMSSNADLNPSFEKFEDEDEKGYLKVNKDGKTSFLYGIETSNQTILMSDGMSYDLSPDKFSAYAKEDVLVMFEAAKLTRTK